MNLKKEHLWGVIIFLFILITVFTTYEITRSRYKRTERPIYKETKEPSKTYYRKPKPTRKVNINTASFSELCSIPQIGKVRAQGIIDGRPYYSINDVLKAKGVGEWTFNKIKDYITVGGAVAPTAQAPASSTKPSPGSLKNVFPAYCLKVFDGDTIVVRDTGSSYRKVRLTGIDTPEVKHGRKKAQPGSYAAKSFTKAACLSKTVYLDIDDKDPKDKYGRTLALVYLNQQAAQKGEYSSLNAMLLRSGHAKILYIPPTEFNPYSWR